MNSNVAAIKELRNNKWKANIDRRISFIFKNFDFTKVALVMRTVDWKWAKGLVNFEGEIPNIGEIKAMAKNLLMDAAKHSILSDGESHKVASGGFEATYCAKSDYAKLDFVLEESEWYPEYNDDEDEEWV